MAQRKVIYGFYDGKKATLGGTVDSINQTVSSRGVQHQMGVLSILQESLSAGTYADKVSIYANGDLAMVLYLTATQFSAFETSVMPALSIIGNIAPHAFDLL